MLQTAVLLMLSTTVRAQFNPGNPAEPQTAYRLTVQADPSEAATVSGNGRYTAGSHVNVSATASNVRWKFIRWTDAAGNEKSKNSSFSYTTIAADDVLTAHYEEVAVSTITLTANFAAGGTLTGAGTYQEGTKVTIKASINNSFTFVSWTDAEGTVVSNTAQFTYTTTAQDAAFTANYRYTPSNPAEPTPTKAKHRVWFTCDPAGSATFTKTSGADAVAEGAAYSVKANPASQFVFVNWSDADTGETISTSATLNLTMGTADRHLVAHCVFEPSGIPEPGSDTREHYALYGFNHRFFNGKTTLYPIYLENTGNVTALTFTLVLPTALTAGDAQTTLRSSGYTVNTITDASTEGFIRYTYTLSGGSTLAGHNGKVLEIALSAVDETVNGTFDIRFEEGTATLANGMSTLSLRDGRAEVAVDESDLLAAFTHEQYMNRVQFTDQSIHAQNVEWHFGDGAVDTIPNPMHIYAEPGTYHVSLTAYGAFSQNIAEKVIVINAPSTWTAEGDFTLDHERRSARNFTSMSEMMTLLSQCKVTGDIAVTVRNNTNYSLDTTNDGIMDVLEALSTSLGTTRKMRFSTNENPDTLYFTTDGSSEALTKVFRLLQRMEGSNVAFFVDDFCVNVSLLSTHTSQTVLTRNASDVVPFSDVCASDHFAISWQMTLASSTVSGYTENGIGDIPSMTLISTSRTQGSVIYSITATLDEETVYTGTYTFYVNPNPEIDPDDQAALTLLYNTLGGTLWTKQWNVENANIDGNWTGVTFDVDGHVTAIALSSNNLAGSLPSEGFTLPYLKSLNLSSNGLTGDIASFVANLPQLTTLNLSRNRFTTLDAALPSTIASVDLGYQYANFAITDLPSQTLTLNAEMQPEIGSILSYNHSSQDFTSRPRLNIYTESSNTYLGRLDYSNDAYKLTLSGDYRQSSGTAVKLIANNGTASGSFVRATLVFDAGDANIDGAVDVLDAQHTINYILQRSSGLFNESAADTYTDQLINVQDVVCTVNLFLVQEPTEENSSTARRSMNKGANIADAVLHLSEGILSMDSEAPVAALDISLTGVHSTDIRLLLPQSRWQMIAHDNSEGVRLVLLSPTGDTIPIHAATLIAFSQEATMTHAMASDENAQALKVCFDERTSMEPSAPQTNDNIYFDLFGRQLYDYPSQRGIYIINGKKMILK